MSFEGQIKDKIYHGCATRYANAKRKLINFKKCERYLLPISEPFWKQPDTEGCCVQMKNLAKKRILIVGPFETIYV